MFCSILKKNLFLLRVFINENFQIKTFTLWDEWMFFFHFIPFVSMAYRSSNNFSRKNHLKYTNQMNQNGLCQTAEVYIDGMLVGVHKEALIYFACNIFLVDYTWNF